MTTNRENRGKKLLTYKQNREWLEMEVGVERPVVAAGELQGAGVRRYCAVAEAVELSSRSPACRRRPVK